jgi:general secretion pathway protein D
MTTMRNLGVCVGVGFALVASVSRAFAQSGEVSDSVTIRVVNMDLRAAVQLIGQYLDRPIVFTGNAVPMVSLETPRAVPKSDVIRILRGFLDSYNYEFVDDTAARIYRARERVVATPAVAQEQQPVNVPRQAPPGGPVELFIIQLKHARASDVATTLNALYGKGGFSDNGGRRQTLGDELRANQVPPTEPPPPQAVAGAAGRAAALTGDVTIVPETRANSLLVRANRNDFQLINAAVQQIDVRPLQVLIEVLIAEVQRDRSLSFGVDAKLPAASVGNRGNTTVEGNVAGAGSNSGSIGLGDFVVKVLGLGGADIEATLRAAAGRGDVSIMSRPVVITANNEEAEIVVGSQRPFVQVSRALPTDGAVRDQVVQYKEVGTKLNVRPTISADGLVQLDVAQEVSNATAETAFNAPVISTRSVQTQLLVRDGQTVVLGGLTDKQRDVSQSGVPFLSAIPILGGLFGRYSKRITETELFVFLTPRVIRTDEDAARLSDPLLKRAEKKP